jgi:hypothetical protein
MSQTMNISQISSNARQILMENRTQEELRIAADIETKYSYLVVTHRDRVVRTLISNAMKGLNTAYINFNRNEFCCRFGCPSEILRETLIRIINSDSRLVGVKISVWNNRKNTVEFRW